MNSIEVNFASGNRDFRCFFVRKQRKTATEQRGVLLFFARQNGRGSRISVEREASLADNSWQKQRKTARRKSSQPRLKPPNVATNVLKGSCAHQIIYFPGESRDPCQPWIPAFDGKARDSELGRFDKMLWNNFSYYRAFPKLFSPSECKGIVDLHQNLQPHTSKMSYLGGSHRDSQLYWLDTQKHRWISERVIDAVTKYNEDMRFEVDLNLGMAQLTAYHPGQFYEWHTDLGAGDTSLRKISLVIELFHSENLTGGGLEILNQNVRLQPGDAVVFPSFALHRALPVTSGVRWSLVQWVLGPEPFK